jgi:release factor family 3
MFLRNDLDELLACEAQPAVSIYLPTHKAGREIRQDSIRLRNLLGTAAARLGADRRSPEVEALLAPARRLVEDEEFWRHQDQGLAIFVAPGFERVHKLPIEVAEEVAIRQHFCIRPLFPIVDPTGWFWLLTITAGRTRLLRGSRWAIGEFGGIDLPQGVEEIYNETVFQEQHYTGPDAGPQRSGVGGLSHAQSFGASPEDLRKGLLLQMLRRIAGIVEPVVRRDPAPVILAAQPEIQGNFRQVASWKELLQEGIQDNPDAMSDEQLREKGWALLDPAQDKSRDDAIGRLNGLIGTGNGKAAMAPEDIVKAARDGRVERLFLLPGRSVWGRLIEAENGVEDRVVAHDEPAGDNDDLLNYAAIMTLRQGGDVTLVEPAQLPHPGPAAAILRY